MKKMKPESPRLGVAVIVLDKDNNLLLGKRSATTHEAGKYGCPGGKVDFGETLVVAAKRELYEETQLKLKLAPLPYVADCQYPGEKNHFVCVWFVARINKIKPKVKFIEKNAKGEPKMESWGWYSADEVYKMEQMLSTVPAYEKAVLLTDGCDVPFEIDYIVRHAELTIVNHSRAELASSH